MATWRIEFNWQAAGLGLAKSVVGFGLGPVAGVLDGFSLAEGEIETVDGKIKLWLNRALADAMLEIFAEAQKETVTELPTHVEEAPLAAGHLPANFLRDPWTLDVWRVAGEPVLTVLTEAGIERPRALELCGDFADRFTLKLRGQWRAMKLDGEGVRAALSTDKLDEACDVAEAWRKERDTLIGWPKDKDNNLIFSREFPIAEIYVPLRGFEVLEKGGSGFDWDVMERRRDLDRKPKARWGDLMTEIGTWLDDPEADGVLRFVSGGPGSGKSTFARLLAATRAAHPQWRVKFLQLHRLRDRDVWDYLTGKGEAVEEAMMVQALAGRRVLLILDGLDELTTLGREGRDRALKLVDRLEGALQDQQDRGRHVRAVILGRDLSVQRAEREATDNAPTLHVQPLTAYDSFVERFEWVGDKPNDDLLKQWWGRIKLNGYDTRVITAGSHAGKAIRDLTELPVTNALLALYLVRHHPVSPEADLHLLEDLDRATLYHDMLKGIHERDWGGKLNGTKLNALTDFGAFLVFLEDVGLACFQDDTRTASLAAVEVALTDPRVKAGLRPALEDSDSLPEQALMAFHVRLATIEGQERLEFAHKSFADYLLARRLLRAAREGVDLGGWARLFGAFRIEMAVVDFLRPEAERQRDAEGLFLTAARDHLTGLVTDAAGDGFVVSEFDAFGGASAALARQVADTELALLATLDAACRGLDGDEAGSKGEIGRAAVKWPDEWAAWRMIGRQPPPSDDRQIHLRRKAPSDPFRECVARLNFVLDMGAPKKNNRRSPRLRLDNVDFRGADLRYANLRRASLEGARLNGSDLQGAYLWRASLADANLEDSILRDAVCRRAQLTGVNLDSADLQHADLQGATFRRANCKGANFEDAKLIDADFREANLQDASFVGAALWNAKLDEADLYGADLRRADLRGASLVGSDLRDVDLSGVNLIWHRGGQGETGIRSGRNVDQAILSAARRASLGLEPQPQDMPPPEPDPDDGGTPD